MFSKLDERYDDTVVFINHNLERLAEFNYSAIQEMIVFSAGFYLVIMSLCFMLNPDYMFKPIFLLFPITMGFFHKFAQIFKERITASFKKVRIFAFFFFIVTSLNMIILDIVIFPKGHAILFPIAMMVISAVYLDYFFVVLALKLALLAIFVTIDISYKSQAASRIDLLIGIGVVFVSMYCFGIFLGIQSDSNQESRELKEKGSTDLLTGLYNKLSFEDQARDYIDNRGFGEGASLLIIDFDNFKSVNDQYGHLVGDQILKRFGEILRSNFRQADVVGRVGGDEFMVMIKEKMAKGEVERRCEIVEHELNVSHIGDAGGFSCSIGVVEDVAGFSFEEMYMLADDALYEAKARGKKQFVKWESREITKPTKKIVYIVSQDDSLMDRIRESFGGKYEYIQEGEATKALNEISLYQRYLDAVFFDYKNLDMEESVLRLYINSRPIFAKVPVCDVEKEL